LKHHPVDIGREILELFGTLPQLRHEERRQDPGQRTEGGGIGTAGGVTHQIRLVAKLDRQRKQRAGCQVDVLVRRVAAETAQEIVLGDAELRVLAKFFAAMLGRDPENRSELSVAWTWLTGGDFRIGFSIPTDPLSMMMMLIVSGVGALIVFYSVYYMDGDDEERRYFAYMALFVFSMLLIVQSGNLLLLLAGCGATPEQEVPAVAALGIGSIVVIQRSPFYPYATTAETYVVTVANGEPSCCWNFGYTDATPTPTPANTPTLTLTDIPTATPTVTRILAPTDTATSTLIVLITPTFKPTNTATKASTATPR